MKHYKKLWLAVAALGLAACAEEFEPRKVEVETPADIARYAYLNEYSPLKTYLDSVANPGFRLGAGVGVADFLKKGLVYSASVSNFNEVVAGNEMKYGSVVGDDGTMNFASVMRFVDAAKQGGVGIYGHTLVWHAQQNIKWLNGLIKLPSGPVWSVVTEQDFETDDAPNYVNDATNRAVLGFTADGEGFDGDGRALTITNAEVRANEWDAQFFLKYAPAAVAGETWRITMNVRSDDPASIPTQAHRVNPGDYIHYDYVGAINSTTEWQTYTKEVVIGSQAGAQVIAFNLGKTATTYYFDNIVWEKFYPTGLGGGVAWVERLVNGDFETDNAANYQANGAAQLSYTDAGKEGRAIKITNPAVQPNGYNAQFIVKFDPAMAAGDIYEFSMDIRADRAAQIGTQAQRTPGAYLGGYVGNIDVTTEWQTITRTEVVAEMGAIAFDLGLHDTNFYFDNISLKKQEDTGGFLPEAERIEVLTAELERWIGGMMEATGANAEAGTGSYVKAWDVVNEPMSDSDPYDLKTADPAIQDDPNFYWQDHMGKDYVRVAVKLARQYGGGDLKLFVNDYNLEAVYNSNNKARGLIEMVKYWESDGVTKIDGIGTQMHVSYNTDASRQKAQEDAIVEMYKLLAATGKLVKVSELDMGIVDGSGTQIPTANVTFEQHQAMGEFYKFIVSKYFELIPAVQRYGITQWAPTDSPTTGGWRANQPIGLWDIDYNRKPAYAGFADGLAGN